MNSSPEIRVDIPDTVSRKIAKYSGYRTPSDIYNEPDPNDPYDIGGISLYETHKKVQDVLDFYGMNDDITKALINFIDNIKHAIAEEFDLSMQSCPYIAPSIQDHIIERKLNFPTLELIGSNAQKWLDDTNIYYRVDGPIIVFQLPKMLARFWIKGGSESWGDRSIDVGSGIAQWGSYYRNVMPKVWELLEGINSHPSLELMRINDYGQHDIKKYYYIWEVIGHKS